eukprot:10855352-Alexandrium_andersonii.AAC.1
MLLVPAQVIEVLPSSLCAMSAVGHPSSCRALVVVFVLPALHCCSFASFFLPRCPSPSLHSLWQCCFEVLLGAGSARSHVPER